MSLEPIVIAVDFDGTVAENAFPAIGAADEEMIAALREAQAKGHILILNTCRVGDRLKEAVQWCARRGLVFHLQNENLPARIEEFGSDCRKISADLYFDDKMAGWNRVVAIYTLHALPDLRIAA